MALGAPEKGGEHVAKLSSVVLDVKAVCDHSLKYCIDDESESEGRHNITIVQPLACKPFMMFCK